MELFADFGKSFESVVHVFLGVYGGRHDTNTRFTQGHHRKLASRRKGVTTGQAIFLFIC